MYFYILLDDDDDNGEFEIESNRSENNSESGDIANRLLEEEIDGEAFLMLTHTDLVKNLGFKLGPAVKIFNTILMIKSNARE